MPFARPIMIDPRGNKRRADQGGGGGGGGSTAKWETWTDFDLSKLADGSEWKKIEGAGIGAIDVTAAMSGDQLHVTFPDIGSGYNARNQGNTQHGLWFIHKVKLDPWANQATPTGQAGKYQSESTLLKIEMQFDHSNGPINGVSAQGYGHQVHAAMGLIAYDNDEGTDPPLPGSASNYAGAYVFKNRSDDPNSSTHTGQYKSGLFSRLGKGGGDGRIWRNQSGSDATSHDAIVFQAGLCSDVSQNPGIAYNEPMIAGSYATTTPFGPMVKLSSTATNNSCRFGGKHLYFACWFGFDVNGKKGGVIRIKKLRYLLQPISARAALE